MHGVKSIKIDLNRAVKMVPLDYVVDGERKPKSVVRRHDRLIYIYT